ncbi:MAG: hypothetical protein SPF30_04635 [Arcanobacterium sp.]|nr:hypothetical protein [Arcanobacterium sp.]
MAEHAPKLGMWVQAHNIHVARSRKKGFNFPAHIEVGASATFAPLRGWRRRILSGATHVILESGHRITGQFYRGDIRAEIAQLKQAGIHVALLFHGSDIRQAQLHVSTVANSPLGARGEYWDHVRAIASRNVQLAEEFEGPVFVSTPGLVPHAPHSIWLPLAVAVQRYATDRPLLHREVPVVLHAPSNPLMKGTAAIEPVLHQLDAEGLIEYRRLVGVPHTQMPEFIADADVIVDQVVLGDYGVLAIEALAAGRLVLGNVSDAKQVLPELPIVDVTVATLEKQLREIVAHRAAYQELAESGAKFAHAYHDGTRAAKVLVQNFLGDLGGVDHGSSAM